MDAVAWNADGLVPAVAQDAQSGEVLMLAWMSRESLARTAESGEAVYWSRSRRSLWRKGETSGHVQRVVVHPAEHEDLAGVVLLHHRRDQSVRVALEPRRDRRVEGACRLSHPASIRDRTQRPVQRACWATQLAWRRA